MPSVAVSAEDGNLIIGYFAIMYEYATGLIRVLEKKILDQADLERMAGAKTALDAFKVLNDTDYGDNLLDLMPKEFEKALARDEKDLRKLFFKIVENKKLLKFLFLKQEFLQLKLYLKEKFRKKTDANLTNASLRINANDANSKKEKKIKKFLARSVLQRLKKLEKITPRKIDEICDLELYRIRKKIAKKMRDKFIMAILKKDLDLNFDLEWIKTEARNYAYGSPIILAYYYRKMDAGRKIRIIMNAKLNNISNENLGKNL